VAYLTRSLRADAGVMLSASHNPADDNGIKFFGADGFKLPDVVEHDIEKHLNWLPPLPEASRIGKAFRVDDARGRYVEFCKASLPRGLRLDGIKVVVDCANGAAYDVAPTLFDELGCDVEAIYAKPDGHNINLSCGSTYPQSMCDKVVEMGADIGFALDGDADRLIACDANGDLVDGDRVIAILAEHQMRHGTLSGEAVVTTLMSNMGLERYLAGMGLAMYRADVGDRYVLEMMREKGCNMGGEQSGHLILLDHNTTGDGLITALQLLCAMREQDKPLSDMASDMALFPQSLWNLELPANVDILSDKRAKLAVQEAEAELGNRGRINVRMSGTEPKLRIMIEAECEDLLQQIGSRLFQQLEELRAQLM